MKAKFIISQSNYKVPGHNGIGRYNLKSKTSNIINKTHNQASIIIGSSILSAYEKFLHANDIYLPKPNEYVTVSLEFKLHTDESRNKNITG